MNPGKNGEGGEPVQLLGHACLNRWSSSPATLTVLPAQEAFSNPADA